MKNFYPYSLPDRVPFHLETIPVYGTTERIDFFYKYKRATENLYLGDIDKNHIVLKNSDPLLDTIKKYFRSKHYLKEILPSDLTSRVFPKVCWLVDSFFKHGFRHPLSAHYNPRIQQHVVHPGSIRNHVIKLFHSAPNIECLYFNTGGSEFDFMKNMRVFGKDELLTHKDAIEIELVADHGSIIPHINLDVVSVKPNIEKWQYFIYRRLMSSSFSIFSNIDILKPWYASEQDANIQIYIKNEQQVTDWSALISKAVILAMIGRSYDSETLSIIHKNSFETPE